MQKTSDINVVETRALPSPAALLAELPKTEAQAEFVTRARREIHRLIFTDDRRFLLIVGPAPSTTSRPAATTPAAWPPSPAR
jgi:3-deoxy-7-phosphoheptulonate synthase